MLALTLLWVANFADYYSSIKDKYTTLYVRSSCSFTLLQFNDTNQEDVEEIYNNIC